MSVSTHSPLQGISILIVDNDTANLRSLKRLFQALGGKVYLAGDLHSARQVFAQTLVQVVLAESSLNQESSLDLLKYFKTIYPSGLFYYMASDRLVEPIHNLRTSNIDGFFPKPVDVESFAKQVNLSIQVDSTSVSTLDPLTEVLRPYLIFRSPVMRRGLMVLPKVAASSHSVLVTGETGTGKEMVARAIHGLSPYSNGPFVAVNCGAIPESLIEGELFGHEKGAFTGAQTLHRGKFELARNGTLFLDEIGEMPLALQARLLRVLEEREFYRIGGEKPVSVNLRIVAATQVDLEKGVEDKLFREDLYYRLNVLRIHLPALRERPEDISLLAWNFLERAFAELNRNKPYPVLSEATIRILVNQQWKGNVRELKNLMTRLAVLLPLNADYITPDHLSAYFPEKIIRNGSNNVDSGYPPSKPTFNVEDEEKRGNIIEVSSLPTDDGVFIPMGTPLRDAEDILIQATLNHVGGNRTRAAKILGIGLRTIRRKINETADESQ